ncbi:MAG: AraC family transcriptional regulator [Spirochaetia bacterium]|nr:AraC family transcriptional regulator [Spirochaetia bacterium]
MRLVDGTGRMERYRILDGIDLIYNDFATDVPMHGSGCDTDLMEINHCVEGSFSCTFDDGSILHMGEGDLAVNSLSHRISSSRFPLGRYKGICLVIHPREAARSMERFPSEITVDIPLLARRFREEAACLQIHAVAEVQHIFSDLYLHSPVKYRSLFILKLLELFLYVSRAINENSREQPQKPNISSRQLETIRAVEAFLVAEHERKVPVCELCDRFGIGMSTLKKRFKGVYGCPVATYHKVLRMQEAARLLRQSDNSIMMIAGLVGYENPSKFAAAFKALMGVSPTQYRNNRSDQQKGHLE